MRQNQSSKSSIKIKRQNQASKSSVKIKRQNCASYTSEIHQPTLMSHVCHIFSVATATLKSLLYQINDSGSLKAEIK